MIMSACGRGAGGGYPGFSSCSWGIRTGVEIPPGYTVSVDTFVYRVSCVCVCVCFFLKVILLSSSHLETREEGNGKANC